MLRSVVWFKDWEYLTQLKQLYNLFNSQHFLELMALISSDYSHTIKLFASSH